MKQSVTITGENLNVVMNGVVAESAASTQARMMSKAEMRIAALKAKGVDTSCYFPLGSESVVKIEDGVAVPVEMMDEVEKKVVEGGYINHYKLFRRWVMSQMFRMLRKQDENGGSFTKLIQDHGYEYSWRVVEQELKAQAKMREHRDMDNFEERKAWFDKTTVVAMANHYVGTLKEYVDDNLIYRTNRHGDKVYKHTCNGLPYVRFRGKDMFVKDLNKKVYYPLERAIYRMEHALDASDFYEATCKFNRLRRKMKSDTKVSQWFIDAYKGSGAYFTCKNLIMFHGATFRNGGRFLGQKKSLDYLDDKLREYSSTHEGWRMMGVLKQLINDSNISVDGKIKEWEK